MGDNDELITSLYPPPPPYYKFFTRENLDRLEAWKSEHPELFKQEEPNEKQQETPIVDESFSTAKDNENGGDNSNESELKNELKFLVPPSTPEGPTYRAYGNIWDFEVKLPSLKEQGMEQLYADEESTTTTKVNELKKLLKSLLLNFLELIGMMSISPENFEVKIENIRKILVNIHHLLNQYRPHQSRESLILLLQKQIEFKKNEIDKIEKTCINVENKIKELVKTYADKKNADYEQIRLLETTTNSDGEKGPSNDTGSEDLENTRRKIIDNLLAEHCNWRV